MSEVIYDGEEQTDESPDSKPKNSKSRNRPDREFKSGSVKLVVWENTAGDGGSFHTFQLSRNYQDNNGDWQQTGSMRVRDLPHVLSLIRRAVQVYGIEERLPGRGDES